MIDTDKYTGHTPPPWKRAKARITTQFCGDEIIVNTGETSWEADMRLIADIPLILEDYKRLQKEHDTVRGWFLDIDNYMMEHHYDMWQEIRIEIGLDEGEEE